MIQTCVTDHWKSIVVALAVCLILSIILILFRKQSKTDIYPLLTVFWTEGLTLFCVLTQYDRTLAAAHAHIFFLVIGSRCMFTVLTDKNNHLYMHGKTVLLGAAILIGNSLWAVYLVNSSDMLFLATITGINLLILAYVYASTKTVKIQ